MSLLSDLNNKIKRLSTRVAEEFKLHQLAINARVATVNGIGPDENGNVEIQTGASLPLGWEYTRLVSDSAPKGGVDYLGQEGTREFYADLWNYVNTEHPDRVISEDDWQAMYASQNGNVPYYSTGDGSTTFRFPRIVSYLRAGDTAGQYTAEGLPDHDHTRGTMEITGSFDSRGHTSGGNYGGAIIGDTTGSFSWVRQGGANSHSGSGEGSSGIKTDRTSFTASRSWTGSTSAASAANGIYGNSTHVTPETITVVMGVIAFGEIRLLGTVTEEGILAEMQTYVKKSGDTMTGSLVIENVHTDEGTGVLTNHCIILHNNEFDVTGVMPTEEDRNAELTVYNDEGLVGTFKYAHYAARNAAGIGMLARRTASSRMHELSVLIDEDDTARLLTTANSLEFGNGSKIWIA